MDFWGGFVIDEGETPQRIPTSCSGRSGFRSTQEIQGTTTYRYNTFILNFMANPMIFRGHFKFPYTPLYLESPHPSPKPGPPVGRLDFDRLRLQGDIGPENRITRLSNPA